MTQQLKTIAPEILRACTGGGDRNGLTRDLKLFHAAGGIPWGYPAGTADKVIAGIYERNGF